MMKTILIADDDKKIVAALALRLRFAGYNVITAQTGEAALRAVNGSHPDLVLMDIWMPAGTGLTVAESLRAGGCELPIIFMTASRKQGLWASAPGGRRQRVPGKTVRSGPTAQARRPGR